MKRLIQKLSICLILLTGIGGLQLSAQNVYEFTPCGATGNVGPTQSMVNSTYTGTSLDGQVVSMNGIQRWIVPATGSYQIEAFGGQGYGPFGGRGAHISGEFILNAGDTLKIIAGQLAGHYLNYPSTTYNHQYGGGGGSFIATYSNTPLIVAGGGGGNHGNAYVTSCDGQVGTAGAAGTNASLTGAGGTNGNGGAQASSADAGAGFFGNGAGTAGGFSFINGGRGGIDEGTGGFGGGGGTSSWNNYRGGGGGGYSGGGGANNGGSCCPAGGGGGSFNSGINQVNLAGVQTGDGMVRITFLRRYPNNAALESIKGFAAPVCAGVYPVEVVVKNDGANQINQVTIDWTVNGMAMNDTTVTALIDTANGSNPDTISVVIGYVNVFSATTINVWTSMPNGQLDSANWNDSLSISIAEPAIATGSVVMDVSCNGGSDGMASAMGTGGNPGYTYLWSTGDTTAAVSGLMTGNYSVQVTDMDGCSHSDTIFVSEPTALMAVTSVNDISCYGETDGNAVVNPVGGTPGYLVVWTPGGTTTFLDSLSAGNYSYLVTDANGCTYTDSVTITEPSAISLSATPTDETAPGNGAIDLTVSGGTAGYTFLWSNGTTTEDLTGLSGGTYTVYVTDANGCMESTTVTVNSTVTAIGDMRDELQVELYPNPTQGNFRVAVKNTTAKITVEVIDLPGKVIRRIENASAVTEINLTEGSGMYFVKITAGETTVVRRLNITK